jgi:hypothetical protein
LIESDYLEKHALPVECVLLTRSANRPNWFSTPVRPVLHLQEVRTARLVSRTGQTGIMLLPVFFHSLVCNLLPYASRIPIWHFTLDSTPQIERYRGNSIILIKYVQMACLGHFWNFSGNAHFQGGASHISLNLKLN